MFHRHWCHLNTTWTGGTVSLSGASRCLIRQILQPEHVLKQRTLLWNGTVCKLTGQHSSMASQTIDHEQIRLGHAWCEQIGNEWKRGDLTEFISDCNISLFATQAVAVVQMKFPWNIPSCKPLGKAPSCSQPTSYEHLQISKPNKHTCPAQKGRGRSNQNKKARFCYVMGDLPDAQEAQWKNVKALLLNFISEVAKFSCRNTCSVKDAAVAGTNGSSKRVNLSDNHVRLWISLVQILMPSKKNTTSFS